MTAHAGEAFGSPGRSRPRRALGGNRPGEQAPVEVAAKEVIAADEWQANGMREDGWQRIPQSAPIAQGIEQRFPKPCVVGSNPAGGADVMSRDTV